MKIEVLYPEICNLYGDLGNIRYLSEELPGAGGRGDGSEVPPRVS